MPFSQVDILEEFFDSAMLGHSHMSYNILWDRMHLVGDFGAESNESQRARKKQWRLDNHHLAKEKDKVYYENNKERVLAKQREHHAANRETINAARRVNRPRGPRRPRTLMTPELKLQVMTMLASGMTVYAVHKAIPISYRCVIRVVQESRGQ